MRRKIDPMFRKVTKQHRDWLSGVHASTYGGKTAPLELFGVTYNRLMILMDMGLVDYKNSLYVLSEKGKTELEKK